MMNNSVWNPAASAPKNCPLLAKVRSGHLVTTTVVTWIGTAFRDVANPERDVQILAWHCRVPSLDAPMVVGETDLVDNVDDRPETLSPKTPQPLLCYPLIKSPAKRNYLRRSDQKSCSASMEGKHPPRLRVNLAFRLHWPATIVVAHANLSNDGMLRAARLDGNDADHRDAAGRFVWNGATSCYHLDRFCCPFPFRQLCFVISRRGTPCKPIPHHLYDRCRPR